MGSDSSQKKKIAIIGVSSILLVAAIVGTVTYGISRNVNQISATSSNKGVNVVCGVTDYKETCEKSLSNATDNMDMKQLVQVALKASIESIRGVINSSATLSEAAKNPSVTEAFRVCNESLDLSIYTLDKSIDKINSPVDKDNFEQYMEDLQTWLSGTIAFQEVCLDAFDNSTGETGEKVKELMKTTRELSSNALAMITELSHVISGLEIPAATTRNLFEDYPLGPAEVSTKTRNLFEDYPLGPTEVSTKTRNLFEDYPLGPAEVFIKTRNLFEDYPLGPAEVSTKTRNLLSDESSERFIDYPPGKKMARTETRNLLSGESSERFIDYPPGKKMARTESRNLLSGESSERFIDYPPGKKMARAETRNLLSGESSERFIDYPPGKKMVSSETQNLLNEELPTRFIDYPPGGRRLQQDGESDSYRFRDYPPGGRRLLNEDAKTMSADHSYISEPRVQRLLGAQPNALKPNAVVSLDGKGQFKSIQAAVNTAPLKVNQTFVILVKAGVYREYVEIPKYVYNILLIGEGPTKTIITGSKNFADGTKTWYTATVGVNGDNFIARDLAIENSAGAIKHQAVALRVSADKAIFYNCHINGYQDTLYTVSGRQFYRDCQISGTVDFIFGDSASVFQNCRLIVRKPMEHQSCMVTAQGRNDPRSNGATVFQNCAIVPAADYFTLKPPAKAFLGRPWKQYSRTLIMQSFIDGFIVPEGWSEWAGTFALDTLQYGEYLNRGPGSNTARRVKWKGIQRITPAIAESFTVRGYLKSREWMLPSGIPYEAGMMKV